MAINHGLMPTFGRERFREAVGVSVSLMNALTALMQKRPFGLRYGIMVFRERPAGLTAGRQETEVTKGEQTRGDIIRKSAPLFNQRGYEGTSLSDLMEATGLQKGGIYRHFSSKEELATEAFDYSWGKAVS